MPRLYRPHIPLEVRCRVVLRQIGEIWPDEVINGTRGSLRVLLDDQLEKLAELLGCKVEDLRLDHDPALATRMKRPLGMTGKWVYTPDANDPEFLIYREKHAHHIKTNVRGDGAQHPDRVLIKRERKRRKERDALQAWADDKRRSAMRKVRGRWPTGRKIKSRGFDARPSKR